MLPINTLRPAFVALCLVLFALAPLACGGEDPQELIDQTFKGEHEEVKSGRLTVGLNIASRGAGQASQPFDVRLAGPFQKRGKDQLPLFDFDLSVTVAGRPITASVISAGNAGFVEALGTPYRLSEPAMAILRQGYQQAQQQTGQRAQNNPDPNAPKLQPAQWLRDPQVAGEEQIAGTETIHVTSQLDVPRLLNDSQRAVEYARSRALPQGAQLPPSLTTAQRQELLNAIKNASFDFWTGKDDKILRRLQVRLRYDVPPAERARTQGIESADITFRLETGQLNQPQRISTPTNARPFEELMARLRSGGIGSLLGGTTPSPLGGAPGAPPALSPGSP